MQMTDGRLDRLQARWCSRFVRHVQWFGIQFEKNGRRTLCLSTHHDQRTHGGSRQHCTCGCPSPCSNSSNETSCQTPFLHTGASFIEPGPAYTYHAVRSHHDCPIFFYAQYARTRREMQTKNTVQKRREGDAPHVPLWPFGGIITDSSPWLCPTAQCWPWSPSTILCVSFSTVLWPPGNFTASTESAAGRAQGKPGVSSEQHAPEL